ncbi:MAG TPA: tetratricopeptide repeat protein, partial [Catenuloplanes sp.]
TTLLGAGAVGPVTLVGLAGVGKTTLALSVAHQVADRHPGGVSGLVVSENSTCGDVLTVIAAVFGAGRATDLAARLAGAPALVLVDAVERAPDAVAEAVHWLARAAPGLQVLATGRHPIGVPGEQVWPVAPLDVPPPEADEELGALARYPAAALFLARLWRVRRSPPGPDEVAALGQLVRRLGGLPLALELAAARGRVLDLNQILDRYGDRVLDLAAAPDSPREATVLTLRDAVAASYRLLEPAERYVLRRLSVFRNRWSVELAELLIEPSPGDDPAAPATDDPVALLDRLLELGLLSVRGSGQFRFRLLDVVRDFATERALARGELPSARRRHATVVAGLATRTAAKLVGPELLAATTRLDDLAGDLSAALAFAAKDDPHTALRLAAALPRWWRFRGRDVVGRHWLRRLLDDPRTAEAQPAVRAWAKVGLAQLALEHNAGAEELDSAESALADFQRLGDVPGELAARTLLCRVWTATGAHDRGRFQCEAVLALATRHRRTRDAAVAQNNLIWHEIRIGDLPAARRRLAAVDRLAAQCGEDRLRALAAANLAEVARLDGRYEEAERLGRRAIPVLEALGDPGHRRRALTTIGLALAQSGRTAGALDVLAELRMLAGSRQGRDADQDTIMAGVGGSADDPACAVVEATIAMHRGERERAAEWFRVAAQLYEGGHDVRDVVTALVGLAASTDHREQRAAVVERLAEVCRRGGITLLPQERELLAGDPPAWSPGALPGQRRPNGGYADSRR